MGANTHEKSRAGRGNGFPAAIRRADRNLARYADPLGNLLVNAFHYAALFIIGAAVIWAAAHEFALIFEKQFLNVDDLLMLFIYLEIGAMVGIYFRTSAMPVRFLVYLAITALTRLLIAEAGKPACVHIDMLWIAGAILLLALALLLLRFGSSRYPTPPSDRERRLTRDMANEP